MVCGTTSCSTVTRRVYVPAMGNKEKATLPNGHSYKWSFRAGGLGINQGKAAGSTARAGFLVGIPVAYNMVDTPIVLAMIMDRRWASIGTNVLLCLFSMTGIPWSVASVSSFNFFFLLLLLIWRTVQRLLVVQRSRGTPTTTKALTGTIIIIIVLTLSFVAVKKILTVIFLLTFWFGWWWW